MLLKSCFTSLAPSRRTVHVDVDDLAKRRRHGGLFLRTLGQAKLPLAPHVLKSWRFAAMGTDAAFEEHLASLTPAVQVTTDFVLDVDGCLTRTKTAVDGKAAAAPA